MKNGIRIMIMIISVIILSSCQRSCEAIQKSVQISERNYHIEHYSGGKLIGTYDFKGILNNSESSDGVYFFKDGTLYELSGDLSIQSK